MQTGKPQSTIYGPAPTEDLQMANNAYVDSIGVMTKLGSDVLSVAGDILDVNFAATPKARVLVILSIINSGNFDIGLRFNGISTNTYDFVRFLDGVSTTGNNVSEILMVAITNAQVMGEIICVGDSLKKFQARGKFAASLINLYDSAGQNDTAALISRIQIVNTQAGSYQIGSRIDVYSLD